MVNEILDLVRENNRVIIPNFGAFIVSHDRGFSVLFNKFLSFNDGLLVNHIATKRGIDAVEALDVVINFVAELNKELDSEGKYVLGSLGVFKKDDSGVIHFQQDAKSSKTLHQPKGNHNKNKELLDIDLGTSGVEEKEEEDQPLTDIPTSFERDPLLLIDQEETETAIELKEEQAEEIIQQEIPQETIEEIIIKTIEQPEKSIEIKRVRIESEQAPQADEEPSSSRLWIWLVLVALITTGFLVYWFVYREAPTPKVVSVPAVVAIVDTTQPVVPVIEPIAVLPAKQFHIIVGSFSIEKNAVNYVDQLKSKGFENAVVVTYKNLFLASIDFKPSLISAETRQEEIVNKYRMENYIITIK